MITYCVIFAVILYYVYESVRMMRKHLASRGVIPDDVVSEPFTVDYVANENRRRDEECAKSGVERMGVSCSKWRPLLYNPNRRFNFARETLDAEQTKYMMETRKQVLELKRRVLDPTLNPIVKKIYEDEIRLHDWQKCVYEPAGCDVRADYDIVTDYYPHIYGQQRVWEEVHFYPQNSK